MTKSRDTLIEDGYLRALALDPRNRPARFNLAKRRIAQAAERDCAVAQLEKLRESARRPPSDGPVSAVAGRLRDRVAGLHGQETDRVWWHATYALALEAANNGSGQRAADLARPAVRAWLRPLCRPRFLWSPVARFAVDVAPPLVVLYAGMTYDAKHCCCEPDPPAGAIGRMLLAWKARCRMWRGREATGPLVALACALPGSFHAKTAYNLACLRCVQGRTGDARPVFRQAVPSFPADLLEWAPRDPSLQPIRDDTVVPAVAAENDRRNTRDAAAKPPKPPEPPRRRGGGSMVWWREE